MTNAAEKKFLDIKPFRWNIVVSHKTCDCAKKQIRPHIACGLRTARKTKMAG